MPNIFDAMQETLFNTVTSTMGYSATWAPDAGGAVITATVLYNGPTEKEKLLDANYTPDKLTMEYKVQDFEGLKQSIDSGKTENITIDPFGEFNIKSIQLKWDGKTVIANLVKITE